MIETNIQVKLDRFDGPLGLLLHLIQREEVSIKELDINKVTHQYLDYLKKLQDVNFDVAGEYLYLAASLLYMKSQSVTQEESEKRPGNADNFEITTKTQLIQKLEELEKFQKIGQRLMALPKRDDVIFVRPRVDRKALQSSILSPMDLESLTGVMIDLLRREKRKYSVVKRDRLSIKEKLTQLKTNLKLGSKTTMDKLIDWEKGKEEVVITFISLLELARLNKLEIFQNEQESLIHINVIGNLDAFDVETADGFEDEQDVVVSGKVEQEHLSTSSIEV